MIDNGLDPTCRTNEATSRTPGARRPDWHDTCRFVQRHARILVLLLMIGHVSAAGPVELLVEMHRQATHKSRYIPVDKEQMELLEGAFSRTFQYASRPEHADVGGLAEQWESIGWQLSELVSEGDRFWVLREKNDAVRGQGFYVVRAGPAQPIIWQSPHSYSDRGTGRLVTQLFVESSAAAAFFNSAHRRAVDVAHTDRHAFNAATRAAAGVDRKTIIIQVHGFAQNKRTTLAGLSADFVFSNGGPVPQQWVHRAAVAVQRSLEDARVRLYPSQVRELGGTTNAQVRLLGQLEHDRFLHLEISGPLRARLLADRRDRQRLLDPLLGEIISLSP